MTVRTRSTRRALGVVAALALAAAAMLPGGTARAATTAPAAPAVSYVPLNGDGSSWAEPAIDQFARDVRSRGIVINFSGDGSAAGREKYTINQNDFAATDIAFLTSADPFGGGSETRQRGVLLHPDRRRRQPPSCTTSSSATRRSPTCGCPATR